MGFSYISDLAESGAELTLAEDGEVRPEGVGAWSAVAVASFGPLDVTGEFVAAAESFGASTYDGDGDGEGDLPRAWNVEGSWTITEEVELAVRAEGSREFAGQPELQYGLCASWGPREGVSISVEYLRGEFDGEFGAGAKERDLLTTQLAVAF